MMCVSEGPRLRAVLCGGSIAPRVTALWPTPAAMARAHQWEGGGTESAMPRGPTSHSPHRRPALCHVDGMGLLPVDVVHRHLPALPGILVLHRLLNLHAL
uniref:Uncharacterized protein n=1 Tax=Eutreptiella gymnastica TaxID=73025 RepID=A0A7S4C8S0_9EUGL